MWMALCSHLVTLRGNPLMFRETGKVRRNWVLDDCVGSPLFRALLFVESVFKGVNIVTCSFTSVA
jgi:ammonia channel protein AmtB